MVAQSSLRMTSNYGRFEADSPAHWPIVNTTGIRITEILAGTNANDQGLETPLRMRWARRLEGTVKHLPVCGGGRLYTHTAEGQIIAVEQDTGRMLWRRYWPDVYLSFTSPLYLNEKLLIPQAGIRQSRMRCLDAATGKLLWEAPFTGSPSWSRQFPPVRARQHRHLRLRIWRVRRPGIRETIYVWRHTG